MALGPLDRRGAPVPPRPRRSALALATVTAVAALALLVGIAIAAVALSHSSLRASRTALAALDLGPLGGHLEHAVALTADGRRIPLADHHGALVPRIPVAPGELLLVDATVRRPGAIAWALGGTVHEQLTLRTPVVRIANPWLTLTSADRLHVTFSSTPAAIALGHRPRRSLHSRTLTLHPRAASGAIEIAAAARPWERLGSPTLVTWFPHTSVPLLIATPATTTTISPTAPLRLTFSRPLAAVLGSALPRLSPQVAGSWSKPNSHTLIFTPSSTGFPLAGSVQVILPTAVANAQLQRTSTLSWSVAGGTVLRLQQLLAQQGYLPVSWSPSGAPVAQTASAQLDAAVDPPAGEFSWRYANAPATLRALWTAGQPSDIVKGAVMVFEQQHGLAVDGIAGPEVWRALLAAAVSGQHRSGAYDYVLVRASPPETLTLYSGNRVVLRTLANTGIPGRSTQLGTFAVFEHIRVGTMSGTNPDGSHYHDPGIPWISYFNGSDAIHGFLRAQYGFPQSLGCVELPYSEAARVWPYTPIGTLVTVAR